MGSKLINYVSMRFKSIPDNVSLARVLAAAVAAQVNMTISEMEDLKVAVSEAVTNAIIHGYRNDPDQSVEVIVEHYKDRLVITVTDQGIGMEDNERALEPAYSSSAEHLGLGFVFMQSFMDSVKINSEPGRGTKITMVKNLIYRQES